ncbi:MAG: hypothetical protein A2Y62_01300 [Candidatus Fischerbacteria bacterium RBG_13_37_8]|uniref:NolW-like domain-containing protein n=1 Tax=Candidatus Fischerbacteria bacterium RBG_13_37_8 TaxID=1817863 RepID=A0A1F5VU69_9BACT|nr:MAG: hypothetical protein A2Y62_01300 [Candidatus Fischerbacteria bacterium RBG_13_37_8]
MNITNLRLNLMISIWLILVICAVAAGEEYSSRNFQIKFKPVEEAATIIEPLLSQQGTITIQLRTRMIIVRDLENNLNKIETVLADFDIPSPSVKMFFKLIQAEQKKNPEQLKNVPEYILKMRDIFKYTDYEVIDEFLLETVEGNLSSFSMGIEYRISFKVTYISAKKGIIQLRNFTIERRDRDDKQNERYKNLLTTSLNLRDQETIILGATKLETSPKALFIALTGQLKK